MKLIFTTFYLLLLTSLVSAQTSLAGSLTNEETGEALEFANIVLYKNGVYSAGTSADLDGMYSINVDSGTYDVEVSYIGLATQKIVNVIVKEGKENLLNIKMGDLDGIDLSDLYICSGCGRIPLIEQDHTTTGKKLVYDPFEHLPTKNIKETAATVTGLSLIK